MMEQIKFTHVYTREHHYDKHSTVKLFCVILQKRGNQVQIKYQDQDGYMAIRWVLASKVTPIEKE